MDVMEILSELADGLHSAVRDEPTLGQDKVSQARRRADDALDSIIFNVLTCGQVQDAETIKGERLGKI
jgi:hypothetical protein